MGSDARRPPGFDGAAAVTRSLLGYGVVAGVFYLVVGVLLGVTRDGFDFASHPLSVLMLGDHGWWQRGNIVLTGLMTLAAAFGVSRALRDEARPPRTAGLLVVFGASLIASGIFPPDPVEGFPPGSQAEASVSGILHLAFGAVGFVSLAVAAFTLAAWLARRGETSWARFSRIGGALVVLGFVGGAALATHTLGVLLLWLAVVAGWVWLAAASVRLYSLVPHPDPDRRAGTPA